MKNSVLIFVLILTVTGGLFGQPATLSPDRFLSEKTKETASPEWTSAYSLEVERLTSGDLFTPAALTAAGDLCRSRDFPADPLLAAAMTVDTLRRSDVRLRSGIPVAEVKARGGAEWNVRLRSETAVALKEKETGADKLEKDLGIAGGKEQSLAKDKKNIRIDDKIREKKDKKDKKEKKVK